MHHLTAYIDGWRRHDIAAVLATLADDCVVIECYGPVYRGRDRVAQWMRTWLGEGGTVDDWQVYVVEGTDAVQSVEWTFTATWHDKQATFDGATIARIEAGKITYLREYATTAPLYEWTGTWRQ